MVAKAGTKQLFLSHAAEDARIASVLRALIERCSLGLATVWFSSDTAPAGGVIPGSPWFDQLVSKIDTSAAFLALVTPTSVSNLWMHYEAGCAAIKKLPIVPVVAGLSVNDVRLPLSLYNAYNLAQPETLKTFLMRLFDAHEIPHHPEMLETPIQNAVREINAALVSANAGNPADVVNDTDRVLRLIDKRFMDLFDQLSNRAAVAQPVFTVSAVVTRDGKKLDAVSVDVSAQDTLGDLSNALYFKLEKYVRPFTYLVQWVVRDRTLGVNLIMRDFLDHVPANAVIKPGHEYEIVLLSRPYDPQKGDRQYLN
jgi:TIR domain